VGVASSQQGIVAAPLTQAAHLSSSASTSPQQRSSEHLCGGDEDELAEARLQAAVRRWLLPLPPNHPTTSVSRLEQVTVFSTRWGQTRNTTARPRPVSLAAHFVDWSMANPCLRCAAQHCAGRRSSSCRRHSLSPLPISNGRRPPGIATLSVGREPALTASSRRRAGR